MPRATHSNSTGSGVAAVERALSILDAFDQGPSKLSLHELAERTGLYKSTILRILGSLMRHECVARLDDGSYAPGPMLLRWGNTYLNAISIDTHVTPVLALLVQQTGESATYYVRQRDVRVCLARVDSAHSVRDHVHVGDVLPLDKGAGGKVLAAFGPGGRRSRMPASMVIATFRERDVDGAGLAAPVFGPEGVLRGAISLSGSASRFKESALPKFTRALLSAAAEVTRRMGGDAQPLEDAMSDLSKADRRLRAVTAG